MQDCFEGHVYALATNTQRLLDHYERSAEFSQVWACEWNIPQHQWREGFGNQPQRLNWFSIQFAGDFSVPQGGRYRFRIYSDDGSRLFIDDQLVVDNDGLHPPRSAAGEIELAPGAHRLRLDYFQGPRTVALQLYVTPPQGSEQIFTSRPTRSADGAQAGPPGRSAQSRVQTVIDLTGQWTFEGKPGPIISVSNNSLEVDMSAYRRPMAVGTVIDQSNIVLTFPDDGETEGRLQPPSTILWSNGTVWKKLR